MGWYYDHSVQGYMDALQAWEESFDEPESSRGSGRRRRRPPSPPITPRKRKRENNAEPSNKSAKLTLARKNNSQVQVVMGKFKKSVGKKRTGYKKKAYTKAKKSFRKKYKKVKRQSFAKKVHAVMDKTEAVGTYRYFTLFNLRANFTNKWTANYPPTGHLGQIGGSQRIADAEAILFKGKAVSSSSWNTGVGNFSFNHKVKLQSCSSTYRITNDTQLRTIFEVYKFVPKKATGVLPFALWSSVYDDEAAGTHTGTDNIASLNGLSTVHTDSQVLKEYYKVNKTVYDLQPGSTVNYSVNLKGKLINWERVVTASTSDTDPSAVTYAAIDPAVPTAIIGFRWRSIAHATTLNSVLIPALTTNGGGIVVEQLTTYRILCPDIADSDKNKVTFTSFNDVSGAPGTANSVMMMNPISVVNPT